MSELMSVSVTGNTVVFTSFPDSLRGVGYLFTTPRGYQVRSSCLPELNYNCIYVCGDDMEKDSYELNFSTVEKVEDFVNSLERFCKSRGISFSREGKIVLGGL